MTVTSIVPRIESTDFASPAAIREKTGVDSGCVRVTLPDGMPSWLTVGHAAMEEALTHPDLVRGIDAADESLRRYLTLAGDFPLARHILFADDDDHRRMKSVLRRAFTRRSVEGLRPWMTTLVDDLIDAFIESGSTDFVQSVALPLPIAVISEVLGVEESDRPEFERRAATMTSVGNDADQSEIIEAGQWFYEFSGELLAARRSDPRDDVMTTMARAIEAGTLTDNEARSNTFLFLSAGYETTVNLLANGLLALLRHPESLRQAVSGRSQAETQSLVEELLRFDSPVSAITYRFARKEIRIAGSVIAAGDHVAIALPTANHDPSAIVCPERLDVTRAENPHLSFGKGTHFCLGAPLARLEGEIALRRTLDRLTGMSLARPEAELEWLNSITVHRLISLPITFTPGERMRADSDPSRR